ncbi:MAG: hypothetical protein ACP5HM_14975 [Anaerolineae bacterium]
MATLPANLNFTHFIKPTIETPFHIDYGWWERRGLDINIELLSHLCAEHKEAYRGQKVGEQIDWIDWKTGEVRQVDGLQYIISVHCSKQPNYISGASTLVESIFRVFLSNGNEPLTPYQLSMQVGYQPEEILRVLSGPRAQKGLRPVLNEKA